MCLLGWYSFKWIGWRLSKLRNVEWFYFFFTCLFTYLGSCLCICISAGFVRGYSEGSCGLPDKGYTEVPGLGQTRYTENISSCCVWELWQNYTGNLKTEMWGGILKGSIFLKSRHFFIQGRFNKLIFSIDTIIKCGIWQPVKFQLDSQFWVGSKMKWFLLHLWINVGNIKSEI